MDLSTLEHSKIHETDHHTLYRIRQRDNVDEKQLQEYIDLLSSNTSNVTIVDKEEVDGKITCILYVSYVKSDYLDVKCAVAGNVDSGKCQGRGTRLRLFDGSIKTIENIKVGDLLMGDDGTPRKVLNTTQGYGQMYRIIPRNGDEIVVNKNHVLCFKASNYNYVYYDKSRERWGVRCFVYENGLPRVKTVFFPLQRKTRKFHRKGMKFYKDSKEAHDAACQFLENLKEDEYYIKYNDVIELPFYEYLNLTKATQSALKLYRVPIDYELQSVCFDPWLLGYWLGDGTQSKPEITTADLKIIEKHQQLLPDYGLQIKRIGKTQYTYGISALETGFGKNHYRNFLREMGLNKEKHIPNEYKYNSREIRLQILAGLVDSDGYLSESKAGYEFVMTKKNERLVDDIIEVCRSLGFASYKKDSIKTCKNGKNGPVKCECLRFSIYGEGIESIPVVLDRKNSKIRESPKDVLLTAIKDITIEPDQEYFGFELDGNGRYLHEDFTVTHNSSLIGCLSCGLLDDGKGKARSMVFNHPHEESSGRTSSIAQHIIGFKEDGSLVSEGKGRKLKWNDIISESVKILTVFDLAGHERYLKTTIRGLSFSRPDFVIILVGANMGVQKMTKEHLGLCIKMDIPFIVVMTKIDLCENRINVLKHTKKTMIKMLESKSAGKKVHEIKNYNDVIKCLQNFYKTNVVPYFSISNVTGHGMKHLKSFLSFLGPNTEMIEDKGEKTGVMLMVESVFKRVRGAGLVVGGELECGSVKVGDKFFLGPDEFGKYCETTIRGIHRKRVALQSVNAGSYVTFAITKPDTFSLKKGMVVVSKENRRVVNTFTARMTILRHSTSIKEGYEPVCHILGIRQTCKILKIQERECLRTGDTDEVIFRFMSKPEYVREGMKVVMCEGMTRGVGTIIKTD